MEEIRTDIKNIFRRLVSGQVVDSNSPIPLTELGQKISTELSIRDWARKTADGLMTKAKGKKEFEIYEICTQYVNDEFQPDDEQEKKISRSFLQSRDSTQKRNDNIRGRTERRIIAAD